MIQHGTDHRSQVCTALTSLGVEPPEIDLWDYGEATGRTRGRVPLSGSPSGDEALVPDPVRLVGRVPSSLWRNAS